jgi:hypothetical protein
MSRVGAPNCLGVAVELAPAIVKVVGCPRTCPTPRERKRAKTRAAEEEAIALLGATDEKSRLLGTGLKTLLETRKFLSAYFNESPPRLPNSKSRHRAFEFLWWAESLQ